MKFTPIILSLVLSGCAAASWTPGLGKPFHYTSRTPTARIGGSAGIEVRYDIAPDTAQLWNRNGFTAAVVQRHREDVTRALADDMAYGNFFDSILAANTSVPDHRVTVNARTYLAGNMARLDLALRCVSGSTGAIEGTATGSYDLGPTHEPQASLAIVLPNYMRALKGDLAAAVERTRKAELEAREVDKLKSSSLVDLLVSSEHNPIIARERNRALVAAKSQLPELLRNSRTNELSALAVRIEQTILDLSHEAEVAKDKAQQSVEAGSGAGRPEEQGYLGVSMGPTSKNWGVLITGVVEGSPAEMSGLRINDLLLSIGGTPLRGPGQAGEVVKQASPGASLRVVVQRGTDIMVMYIVIGKPAEPQVIPVERLREFAISYRERIELLKPVLAALREEIANRNR